jgi:hypothetical protein
MLKLNLVFGNILLIFLSMEREALPRTLGKLKELTVKSVCAVRAPLRGDAHTTYILITQVVASDLVQCEIPAVNAQN